MTTTQTWVNKLTIKKLLTLAFVSMLALSVTMVFQMSPVYAQGPYIGVYPPHVSNVQTPQTFTVKINVSSTVGFVGYQFYLYWNRTYINATGLTDTPPPAMTFFAGAGIEWDYNTTHGRIERTVMNPSLSTVTGTYQVATITFQVLQNSVPPTLVSLDLDYEDTFLSDATGSVIEPYYVYDGNVPVVPEFPVFLVIPLFAVLTLVAVILGKKSFLKMRKDSLIAN
jgi:hypothetical protein